MLEKLKYGLILIVQSMYSSVQNTGTDNAGKGTCEVTGRGEEHNRRYQIVFSLPLQGHSKFSSSTSSRMFFPNWSVLWRACSVPWLGPGSAAMAK